MLGDTGANAVGAALGFGVVITTPLEASAAVVLVLLALNLASEVVSFSTVIDRVPPLRALDRLGRLEPPAG
jgi:UDP-N-acetylmuramyl pentapeptide phosphotransferase/UDP-N-acetylglucosamine-1-phosphate transferase